MNEILLDLKRELLKFLNCILSRVNLCSQRMPSHLKTQSLQLLKEDKVLLNQYLTSAQESESTADLVNHLECYYTLGLIHLLIYRYSLTTTSSNSTTSIFHSTSCFNELKEFLKDLNSEFKLSSKLNKELKSVSKKNSSFEKLFYLVIL